jgi:hypothetical protein
MRPTPPGGTEPAAANPVGARGEERPGAQISECSSTHKHKYSWTGKSLAKNCCSHHRIASIIHLSSTLLTFGQQLSPCLCFSRHFGPGPRI